MEAHTEMIKHCSQCQTQLDDLILKCCECECMRCKRLVCEPCGIYYSEKNQLVCEKCSRYFTKYGEAIEE